MIYIALKIFVSIIIVVSLAEISKRINPLLGGILNGLPLGTGLSVYFISIEKGTNYIVNGIPWGIAALSSSLLFCLVYLITGKLLNNKINNYLSIIISSLSGIIIFLLSGFLIRQTKLNLIISIIIFILFYIFNGIIIKYIIKNNNHIVEKKSSGFLIILIRGVIVSIIIIILTTAGSIFGSKWAGILSSFPSTLYALIIILHYEDGNKLYPSVIFGFSFGIIILLVFYILCFLLLPLFNINITYLIIYILCFIFILLYIIIIKYLKIIFYKK